MGCLGGPLALASAFVNEKYKQIKNKIMKKSILAVIALLTLSFASCKKEYKCECQKTRTGSSTTVSSDDGEYTFKDTRARAESRCNDQESTGSDAFGDYSRDCEIR
jgi:hypothetical protein